MKKKTVIILTIAVITLVITGILIYEFVFKKSEEEETAADTTPTNTSTFPLKKGTTGIQVTNLQTKLNKYLPADGIDKLTVDGIWGTKTDEALQYFITITPGLLGYTTTLTQTQYNNILAIDTVLK